MVGFISFLFILFQSHFIFADEVNFNVEADREQITLDESVTLKFEIYVEGAESAYQVGEPQFNAPDFKVVNTYDSPPTMQNLYINGQFFSRFTNEVFIVLRALKTGTFKIDGLAIQIGQKKYTAPALQVEVVSGGQATPPPSGYGGLSGLRGAGKQKDNRPFIVRAELNKNELYKGEQVIVSYYLYSTTSISDFSIQKYPVFDQFFREDLDIPALNKRMLEWESVVLDGISYKRTLLAQYAAYPLSLGELRIASMSVKASYIVPQNGGGSGNPLEDHPFFGGFFAQTRMDTQESEQLKIKVKALPEQGKPPQFKESVGQFEMIAAIDKNQVKAGEAVNLVVNIQGRGNVGAIQAPELILPKGIKLYETKSKSKLGRAGSGQKVFETLLVPQTQGAFTIPPIVFHYFDPEDKKYKTSKSDEFTIQVEGGTAIPEGQDSEEAKKEKPLDGEAVVKTEGTQPSFKPPYEKGVFEPDSSVIWKKRASYLGFFGAGFVFLALFILMLLRTIEILKIRSQGYDPFPRRYEKLKKEIKGLGKKKVKKDFLSFLLKFQTFLMEALEYYYDCPEQLLAYPRSEWTGLLVESGKMTQEDFSFLEVKFNTLEKWTFSGEKKDLEESDFREVTRLMEECGTFIEKCRSLKKIQKKQ